MSSLSAIATLPEQPHVSTKMQCMASSHPCMHYGADCMRAPPLEYFLCHGIAIDIVF